MLYNLSNPKNFCSTDAPKQRMGKTTPLADFLSTEMEYQAIGDAKLASRINNRFPAELVFVNRSTVRNWRDETSRSARDWKQIVAIANILSFNGINSIIRGREKSIKILAHR